jgi:LysM repeat protein
MRLITCTVIAVIGLFTAVACSGDDSPATPTATTAPTAATPAPTATPLARVPDPIVVTGSGLPSSGVPSTEDLVEYTVESGDNIGAIAERFGVPADTIREANDIEDDQIFIGQVLVIPRGVSGGETTGGTTPDATATPPPSGDGSTYVVQEGDTAFGIAIEFDTTVEALAAANGMTEDEITNLQIGQVINLPSPN